LPTVAIANNLKTALAKTFAGQPQVRHVLTEQVHGALFVWIALDDASPSARRPVYQKQLKVISDFPEVDFDFNLVPSMGRSAKEISTTATIAYSRPA